MAVHRGCTRCLYANVFCTVLLRATPVVAAQIISLSVETLLVIAFLVPPDVKPIPAVAESVYCML